METISTDFSIGLIRNGRFFSAGELFSLSPGELKEFCFKTSATLETHFLPVSAFTSADKVTIYIYEGAEIIEGTGNSLKGYNHNRKSEKQTYATIISSPQITHHGTLFSAGWIPGDTWSGSGGTRQAGIMGIYSNEWILKPDTGYLAIIENESRNENKIQISFNWYEIPLAK